MTHTARNDVTLAKIAYMTELLQERSASGPARKVTIRQLQQHAAKVIDELAEAQEIGEITRRGQLIARLVPVSPAERAFAEMLERGEVIPARNGAGLTGWQPLPPRDDEASLSDLLIAMRDQERG
jgi:antitoxin (DNA-binding transcriptional repressor) of toxin-antitoxin stability system